MKKHVRTIGVHEHVKCRKCGEPEVLIGWDDPADGGCRGRLICVPCAMVTIRLLLVLQWFWLVMVAILVATVIALAVQR